MTDRIGTDKNGRPRTRGAFDRVVGDIVQQQREQGRTVSAETVQRRVAQALEKHDRRK